MFFNERTALQNGEILGVFYEQFDMDLYRETLKQMDIATDHIYGKMSRGEKIKMQLAFAIALQKCYEWLLEAKMLP